MSLPLLLASRRHLVVSIQPGSLPPSASCSVIGPPTRTHAHAHARTRTLLLYAPRSSITTASSRRRKRKWCQRGRLHMDLPAGVEPSPLCPASKPACGRCGWLPSFSSSRNQSVKHLSLPRVWRNPASSDVTRTPRTREEKSHCIWKQYPIYEGVRRLSGCVGAVATWLKCCPEIQMHLPKISSKTPHQD